MALDVLYYSPIDIKCIYGYQLRNNESISKCESKSERQHQPLNITTTIYVDMLRVLSSKCLDFFLDFAREFFVYIFFFFRF